MGDLKGHIEVYCPTGTLKFFGVDFEVFPSPETAEIESKDEFTLLESKIAEGMAMGFNHIFCIIDMDTKDKEPEHSQYQRLRKKYAQPINKPKKGIYCEVQFFETHRCTELFFLYYFRYTSRMYTDQGLLLKDLNQCVEYRKTAEFFIKSKGLHSYFERNGGSLASAIENAERSMDEKQTSERDYTYSELGRLMEELKKLMV